MGRINDELIEEKKVKNKFNWKRLVIEVLKAGVAFLTGMNM